MGTLIYAPAIEVRIATADGTIYDVSADVSQFNMNRPIGIASLNLTLTNAARKYDGVFAPMDRVVVYLRRVSRMLVFSGYLDQVPVFSTFPGSVKLRASCSLKRLQHFMWDPTTAASINVLKPVNPEQDKQVVDGGTAARTVRVLNEIAGWPKEQIHIASVPASWVEKVSKIADKLTKEAEVAERVKALGSGPIMWGNDPSTGARQVITGIGPGTGRLPAYTGKASYFGGPGGGAYGGMTLTGEPGGIPDSQRGKWGGPYYCAMQWPYQTLSRDGEFYQAHGLQNIGAAIEWWRGRKILVVSPKTGKGVVVRAADWGPHTNTGRVIDLSKPAFDALGINTDDEVNIAFADEGSPMGPVSASGLAISSDPALKNGLKQAASGEPAVMKDGWNHEGKDMVTVSAGGCTFQVAKQAAPRFKGFVDELVSVLHYQPKQIGGYRANSTVVTPGGVNTGKYDNHGYGAAIDIDPFGLGNGFYSTPGDYDVKHKIPDSVRELAHKWGLWWGGDYHSIKDYMHFEVIGAPATPKEAEQTVTGAIPPVSGVPGQPNATDSAGQEVGTALFNAFQWLGSTNFGGELLTGIRALMNDQPLYGTIDELMNASLRHWCSAPNGDIIAWFPDYFGHFGTAAKLIVEDIEILDAFAVAWSDDRLKTHMFVTSSTTGFEGMGDASEVYQQMGTAGIASVEFPELMSALFNVPAKNFADGGKAFLNRFGARPDNYAMNNITGHQQEFFFACFRFMQNWGEQFSCQVSTTFLPEAYPGMLLVFPRYGVQAYIQEVNHQGSLGDGGGFTTDLTLVAWSTIGSQRGIKGLPRGGAL